MCCRRGLTLLDEAEEANKDAPPRAVDELSGLPLAFIRSQLHAEWALALGSHPTAANHYDRALDAWDSNVVALFNAAEHRRERGELRAAITAYRHCVAMGETLQKLQASDGDEEDDDDSDDDNDEEKGNGECKQGGTGTSKKEKASEKAMTDENGTEEEADDELQAFYGGWWGDQLLTAGLDAAKSARYMLALTLHLTGSSSDFSEGAQLLAEMELTRRIAPNVWTAARACRHKSQQAGSEAAAKASRDHKGKLMTSKKSAAADATAANADTTANAAATGAAADAAATSLVRMWRNIVPSELGSTLRSTFAPEAAYWSETDYHTRGYYSFWFDVHAPPSNAVEALINTHLRPLVEPLLIEAAKEKAGSTAGKTSTATSTTKSASGEASSSSSSASILVGCEWWVHSRPVGKASVGHQLHYDTDELALAQGGEVHHPLMSSVVYLTGSSQGGAPTLVLDQFPTMGSKTSSQESPEDAESSAESKKEARAKNGGGEGQEMNEDGDDDDDDDDDDEDDADAKFATRGWLARPEDGAFLVFPGDRLHGVLPDAPATPLSTNHTSSGGSNKKGGPSSTSSGSSASSGSASSVFEDCGNRLTLMVGWWTRDPNAAAEEAAAAAAKNDGGKKKSKASRDYNRRRNKRTAQLGPCAPVPPLSARSTTWVQSLALNASASSTENDSKHDPKPRPPTVAEAIAVQELSPVWEKLELLTPENSRENGTDEHEDDNDDDDEFEEDEESEVEGEDSSGRLKKKMRLEPLRAEEEATEPSGEEDQDDAEEVFGVCASDLSEAGDAASGGDDDDDEEEEGASGGGSNAGSGDDDDDGDGEDGGGDLADSDDESGEIEGEWVEEPPIPPRLDGHFFVAGASAFSPTAKVPHF